MSEKLESSREELTALRVKEMKEKTSMEFSRYKQDCRKRALDLAHGQLMSIKKYVGETPVVDKEGKAKPFELLENELLISMADHYYNWLISIPEK